jgi:2-keto-4-pentenoate hydratase
MQSQRTGQAADILWSAWQEKRLLEALPEDCRPNSLEEGYAIQDAIGARHGGEAIGWKIAATSSAGQRHIGVTEPLGGRLFARFCHPDGARLPAGKLHMRVAEAEFAFRMAKNLPPRDTRYTTEEVMAAVGTLHLAIEVPDSRYRDFARIGAPHLVADDSCACFFVLGDEAAGWRGLDLAAHPVVGHKNGTIAERGSGANVLGDPRIALAWLANDRAARGEGLKAGQIVTTGTCVKPMLIAPGDQITADFGALGRVRVEFS